MNARLRAGEWQTDSGVVVGVLVAYKTRGKTGVMNSSVRLPGNVVIVENHDNVCSMLYCSKGRAASGSSRLPMVTLMLGPSIKL